MRCTYNMITSEIPVSYVNFRFAYISSITQRSEEQELIFWLLQKLNFFVTKKCEVNAVANWAFGARFYNSTYIKNYNNLWDAFCGAHMLPLYNMLKSIQEKWLHEICMIIMQMLWHFCCFPWQAGIQQEWPLGVYLR